MDKPWPSFLAPPGTKEFTLSFCLSVILVNSSANISGSGLHPVFTALSLSALLAYFMKHLEPKILHFLLMLNWLNSFRNIFQNFQAMSLSSSKEPSACY